MAHVGGLAGCKPTKPPSFPVRLGRPTPHHWAHKGRYRFPAWGSGAGAAAPREEILRIVLAAKPPARYAETASGRAVPFLTYPYEPPWEGKLCCRSSCGFSEPLARQATTPIKAQNRHLMA